ncbi:hypothetical protein IQ07DRAFT_631673 [Pyrenochaeta sp. DS3sAY3a]|nr:hypothetical protein IQ07DRAFT_631673 [Pyrenochaeta sp. DS3sAY3a]
MHSSKERENAPSPGAGAFYSPSQMKSYLQDLRTNRPARPTGSRPPPAHFNTWSSRSSGRFSESPAVSPLQRTFTDPVADVDARPSTAAAPSLHIRRTSNMSIDEVMSGSGRPLVQPPRGRDTSRSSVDRSRTPSVQYRESEHRQAEQDEARAVRIAMEELELAQEEKLYHAAQDEAAELVWKHINPRAAEKDPNSPYAYPGLTRKGSTQRSRSVESKEQDLQRANSKLRKRHSMGSTASGSRSSSLHSDRGRSDSDSSTTANAGFNTASTKVEESGEVSALAKASKDLPDGTHRRRSSGARRTISGSLFRNPNDQIYEEPEEEIPVAPAPTPVAAEPSKPEKLPLGVRRNPFMRFQSIKGNPMTRSNTDPVLATKRFDRYEIQNNPPTQSRNAAYTLNPTVPIPKEESKPDVENEPEVKTKEGKEIRSDDIRAATGFRLKDRSAKLPTPTAVSNAPGRPIVSFKKDWNVVEIKEDVYAQSSAVIRPTGQSQPAAGPRPLSNAATAPIVPTINHPEEVPKRAAIPTVPVPETKVSPNPPAPATRVNRVELPIINIYEDPPTKPSTNTAPPRRFNNSPQPAAPSVPTINVSQAPAARFKPSSAPSIPTISVSETPSISVSAPSGRGSNNAIPSIGVTPPIPSISISESPAPARGASARGRDVNAPMISVTPDIPTISVSDAPTPARRPNAPPLTSTSSVPSINVGGPAGFGPAASTRPLPNPRNHNVKAHSYNGSAAPRTHWTPTTVRTGALCSQCALPIAGRIVSAGGVRFHPECFTCYQCGEHLECVAFYPEPTNKLSERVNRIRARLSGQDIAMLPSHPTANDMARLEAEDGTDESQRFFCHLDFHELFSPRCKSCKTPIEGEVIVACGAEWHAGHFFCAQCGDPFDSSTPFVEKEGYAWCVNCHTHRFSTKCKGCRKPVTDMVVKALNAEWHAGCFVCVECSGPFEDGRYFLRGDSEDPVCVRCEERRLKA